MHHCICTEKIIDPNALFAPLRVLHRLLPWMNRFQLAFVELSTLFSCVYQMQLLRRNFEVMLNWLSIQLMNIRIVDLVFTCNLL